MFPSHEINNGKEITVSKLFNLALCYQGELAEDWDAIGLEVV